MTDERKKQLIQYLMLTHYCACISQSDIKVKNLTDGYCEIRGSENTTYLAEYSEDSIKIYSEIVESDEMWQRA